MQDRVQRSGTKWEGQYPEFKTWIPADDKTLATQEPDYVEFTHIARTVHFEDYLQGELRDTLMPYETEVRHLTLLKNGIKGLWFRALDCKTEDGIMNKGDWLGNVMYKVDFHEFCDKFLFTEKYKAYFMEVVEYPTCSATRILIASPDSTESGMKSGWGFGAPDTEFTPFPEYNHLKPGGPWHMLNNKNYYLKNHRKCSEETIKNEWGSTLDFFLVLDEADIQQLYRLSAVISVPHYPIHNVKAARHDCHKYRSGRLQEWCPSHCSIEQADAVRADIKTIALNEANKVAACHMLQIVPKIVDMINKGCSESTINIEYGKLISTLEEYSREIIGGLSYEEVSTSQQVTRSIEEIQKIMTAFLKSEFDQIGTIIKIKKCQRRKLPMAEKKIVTDRVETWMQDMIKEIKEHLCQQ